MKHQRTFRRDKLYHQFMRSRGIPIELLDTTAKQLAGYGFIKLLPDDRYEETEKLTNGKHKKELFKALGLVL